MLVIRVDDRVGASEAPAVRRRHRAREAVVDEGRDACRLVEDQVDALARLGLGVDVVDESQQLLFAEVLVRVVRNDNAGVVAVRALGSARRDALGVVPRPEAPLQRVDAPGQRLERLAVQPSDVAEDHVADLVLLRHEHEDDARRRAHRVGDQDRDVVALAALVAGPHRDEAVLLEPLQHLGLEVPELRAEDLVSELHRLPEVLGERRTGVALTDVPLADARPCVATDRRVLAELERVELRQERAARREAAWCSASYARWHAWHIASRLSSPQFSGV